MSPQKRLQSERRDQRGGQKDFHRETPRRRSLGGDQIEGRQAVRELLLARKRTVEYVWIEESVQRKGIVSEIADLCLSRRVPLLTMSHRRFDQGARSESHQGVLARAAALRDIGLDELVEASPEPFLVLVDGITDPHNLGAVLRSAELAGVTGVVLPQNRTSLITPTVAKAAAGAIEHLDFSLVSGIPSALLMLREAGFSSIGLDVRGKGSVYSIPQEATSRVAVVLGSEDKGIARLSAERCDLLVRIPQLGKLDSLNVSAAAAIAFFELSRLRTAHSTSN